MDYRTKYQLNYCNTKGVPLRIDLQMKGYVGETFILVNNKYLQDEYGEYIISNIDGDYDADRDINSIESNGDPFILTYKNDLGEKAGVIRATYADMSFYEDDLFNIDDLATSDETGIRCVFYYNNEVEWVGFVTPDFFNVEITQNPVINLTASDRIGILKDIAYDVPDIYTREKKSYAYILSKALKNTGLDLNINVIADFYCDEFVQTSRPNHALLDTYISEIRYVKDDETGDTDSCYDVIKDICNVFNCFITQYKGEWWMINKRQLEVGIGEIFTFNSNGDFVSKDIFNQREINFSLIDVGGERTLIPAGAKNTYLLDHGENIIYPLNRTFKGRNVTNISGWTFKQTLRTSLGSSVPLEYNYEGDWEWVDWYDDTREWLTVGDSEYMVISTDPPSPESSPRVENQGEYIFQSAKFDVPTLDKQRLSFDLTVKAVGMPYSMCRIMIVLEFDDPVHKYAFLADRSAGGLPTGEYFFRFNKFINDTDYTNIDTGVNDNLIPLFFENKYRNRGLSVENEFKISVDAAGGRGQEHLDLTKSKMFVRIYPNLTQGQGTAPRYATNIIKEIKIDFKSDSNTPKGTVFQNTLEGSFTKPTDDRKVKTGDYQTFGQNGYFYKYREDSYSIQYNELGETTKNWTTAISQDKEPLLVHSVRQLADSYSRSHEELSIGFDLDRINPLAHYAIYCISDSHLVADNDYKHVLDPNDRHVLVGLGKYLNRKRYLFTEGAIDYMRMHFKGKLSQVIESRADIKEFIYSFFDNEGIS